MRGLTFTTCEVDLRQDDLRLFWRNPATGQPFGSIGAVARWARSHGRALRLATNAGIYALGYVPLGLYVENGREEIPLNRGRGGGNCYLKPNGVFFVVGDQAGIVEASRYPRHQGRVRLATQSWPLLVIGGRIHPAFRTHSSNRNLRSGVGGRSPDRVVFALSDKPVTFY